MPYKSEKIIISHTKHDRRIKLTEEQREQIRRLRREENLSQRKLAAMFGVSRRLITFILDDNLYEQSKKSSRERHREGRYKYTKEEWAKVVREHRAYKQSLYVNGEIR